MIDRHNVEIWLEIMTSSLELINVQNPMQGILHIMSLLELMEFTNINLLTF